MKLRTIILTVALLGLYFGTMVGEAPAQDRALQQLIQGKKFFWEAKFDQALASLRQVIGVSGAKTEYLFEAYLYMGFVLTRQNASTSDVNAAFEQAIKLDPRRKLDEMIIPPDLVQKFKAAHRDLVGCLYIKTEPADLNLMIVENDSVLFSQATPTEICDLVSKNYQLLLTKEGYEQELVPLELEPGETDTLFVQLKPSATPAQKSGGGKSVWGWVARGGIVAAGAAILYTTVLQGGEENLNELPAPPDRPVQ